MELAEYRAHLAADGARLVAAARSAPEARVPSCPDWTMRDLLCHIASIHEWVATIISEQVQEARWPRGRDEFPETVAEVAETYDKNLAWLLEVLDGADPKALVWNWYDQKPAPAGFWFRRMAQETVVHRIDAEEGAGMVTPIDADLASDGIAEYLYFLSGAFDDPIPELAGSLSFEATDSGASWRFGLSPDRIQFDPPEAPAGWVRAPASDLYLWILHRNGALAAPVVIEGDAEVVDQWESVRFT